MNATLPATDAKWRMLSQTAEYALRVVLHLAADPHSAPTSAAAAAATLNIPERYLARVLNVLTREGVLVSTRGAQGGVRLARPAADLTLAAVVAPFDAVGESQQCLLRGQRCDEDGPCMAHREWHDVATRVRSFFNNTTIADLIADAAGQTGDGPLPLRRPA